MASPLATRRVGRRVNQTAGAAVLYVFGPFLPGEGVDSVHLGLAVNQDLAIHSEAYLSVGVSTQRPKDATDFLASARMLTDGVPSTNGAPGVPVGGPFVANLQYAGTDTIAETDSATPSTITGVNTEAGTLVGFSGFLTLPLYPVPIGWEATAEERYLSFLLLAPAGDTLAGSLWVRVCGRPDAAPVVPPSPGVVGEDCE